MNQVIIFYFAFILWEGAGGRGRWDRPRVATPTLILPHLSGPNTIKGEGIKDFMDEH
jgi:hypothetical protein